MVVVVDMVEVINIMIMVAVLVDEMVVVVFIVIVEVTAMSSFAGFCAKASSVCRTWV